MDKEAAQQFAELLARYQAHWPQAHWTAAKLLSSLVTDAWRHQIEEPRRLGV